MKAEITMGVLEEVLSERARQDERFGIQDIDLELYYLILAEEVGEVAKAILEERMGAPTNKAAIRTELIQVAAGAVAMVERIDRMKSDT